MHWQKLCSVKYRFLHKDNNFYIWIGDYMKNCQLIFENNSSKSFDKTIKSRLKFVDKRFYYKTVSMRNNSFTGDQILELITVIQYIWRHYGKRVPITIDLGNFSFADKLVYVVLETIYYYLIKEVEQDVELIFSAEHTIWSEGIKYSPLAVIHNRDEFLKKFNLDLSMCHFRRTVPDIENRDETFLSKLMQEIFCFLQNNAVKDNTCHELSEALIEVIGNAGEHGNSDCILDIDITKKEYLREDNSSEDNYYGVNAVVLNYSNILFYEPLKSKLSKAEILPKRYGSVLEAEQYHLQNLNTNYFADDFYTISSFQHKISGSTKKNAVGGTGLTRLLLSLEENSDSHCCYMLSGKRALFFEKNLMLYDENHFVGFNESNNYLTDVPDLQAFKTIRTFFPGVAYNLNYAVKKEW